MHPKRNDLYTVGTVSIVKQVLRLPGENMRILVEGQYRAELLDIVQSEPYLFGRMQKLEELPYQSQPRRAWRRCSVRRTASLNSSRSCPAGISQEALLRLLTSEDRGLHGGFHRSGRDVFLSEQAAACLSSCIRSSDWSRLISLMAKELDILRLEDEISDRVQENVDKNQRDYYLREQMQRDPRGAWRGCGR